MWSIETLILVGNPIANSCPALASNENDQELLKKSLQQYFGMSGNQGISSGGLSGLQSKPMGMGAGAPNYSTAQHASGPKQGGMGGYASKPMMGGGLGGFKPVGQTGINVG